MKSEMRKHASKKVTDAQKKAIEGIQRAKGYETMLEAKHEYFENLERYEAEKTSTKESIQEKKEEPKKRGMMTIGETKLGVTLVLSKDECAAIGLGAELQTKEAIKIIKKNLGLKW